MVPSPHLTSSSPSTPHTAASLDAAHSTLCKLVLGLSYDEACVLLRLGKRMRAAFDRWGPLKLEPAAREFVLAKRESIEDDLALLTYALVAAGRCA